MVFLSRIKLSKKTHYNIGYQKIIKFKGGIPVANKTTTTTTTPAGKRQSGGFASQCTGTRVNDCGGGCGGSMNTGGSMKQKTGTKTGTMKVGTSDCCEAGTTDCGGGCGGNQ